MLIDRAIAPLVFALALLAAAVALIVVVRNRVVRRRLLFSAVAAAAAVALHLLAIWLPGSWILSHYGWRTEQLVVVLAVANLAIALAFNPWFRDGESDRAPAIVQDVLVVAAVIAAGLVLFHVSSFDFLTGSAIVAAIVGFALQDTLGNAFAGIAIQIERPFRVGHWIAVGDHVGVVTEVTWRATKIRTKSGNLVAVPNSQMASQAINNYSQPTAPTRLNIDVGAAYGAPPNEVRAALLTAARASRHVLESPAPDVMITDFGSSAILYRVWLWVDDFSRDDQTMTDVRTFIYYEFRRRNIEIPWPIQIEYQREDPVVDLAARRDRFATAIAAVPVLVALPPEAHQALASSARELLFADGEMIVREGQAGGSMFLVLAGTVAVTVGHERREVAVTTAGGYFGEMSLLTGDPRTATVVARGDATVLEITADAFRAYVQSRPDAIDRLAAAAGARRRELDDARAATGAAPVAAGASLRDRMRLYFGLS